MVLPPIDLHVRQLSYLREAARTPTLTEAAETLGISQPALSQSLAELERRLGVALFERSGRSKVLTADGEVVLAHADRVVAETERLGERLSASRGGISGRLRVGMIDAAGLYVLPDAVRQYRSSYPGVDLQLVVAPSSELLRGLVEFGLDLVFVTGPVADDRLAIEPVHEEPLHLYAGDDGVPDRADWVMYPRSSNTRRLIDEGLSARGISPKVVLESGNPQVLRQMVALGFGWSVLPEAVAASGGLGLRRHDAIPVAHRTLLAVRRRSTDGDPRVEHFKVIALESLA